MKVEHSEPRLTEEMVRNLVDEFAYQVMTADAAAWAATWAPDGIWSVPGAGLIEGREKIRGNFDDLRSMYIFCIQEVLGLQIKIADDGRSAQVRCMVREVQWSGSDREPVGSELIGTYFDRVELEGERAAFASRDFELLYSGPADLTGRFHRAAYERSWFLERTEKSTVPVRRSAQG